MNKRPAQHSVYDNSYNDSSDEDFDINNSDYESSSDDDSEYEDDDIEDGSVQEIDDTTWHDVTADFVTSKQ